METCLFRNPGTLELRLAYRQSPGILGCPLACVPGLGVLGKGVKPFVGKVVRKINNKLRLALPLLNQRLKLRGVSKRDLKMKEQRRSDRRRTYLAGRIAFNGRSSTMDCLVRNLSRNGAMLEFSEPVIPRHEVDLCILSRAESLRARLVWCTGARVGVSIERPDTGAVITIETARLIRKLKADREALAKRVAELREPV